MDFIIDGLATGRMVRILGVVDAYTRECLTMEADTSLGSGRVTRALERLIGERVRPKNLSSDNGPEFNSRRMLGRAEDRKVRLAHIPVSRCRTGMSKASTDGCATSASTQAGSER